MAVFPQLCMVTAFGLAAGRRGRRRRRAPSGLAFPFVPPRATADPRALRAARTILFTQPNLHSRVSTLEAAGHVLVEGHPMWSATLTPGPRAPTAREALERAQCVRRLCALLGPMDPKARHAVLGALGDELVPPVSAGLAS